MEDQRRVGVARMVGSEDHGAFQLRHPLATLNLGMGHHLGEWKEEASLDQPAKGPDGFLARPAEITCGRRHDSALLGPGARPRRVPMPASPPAADVPGDAAAAAHPLHWPAIT